MPKKIDDLNISIKFKDAGSVRVIEKVSSSIRQLQSSATSSVPRLASLRREILNQGKASRNSIADIKAQSNSLKGLREEARLNSTTFKQLTADIAKLDQQLEKAQGRKSGVGNRGALRAAQGAGAVISGGIFGGPEGLVGGLGGLALGGVEGAFAGAAMGAVAGNLRKSIGGTAEYAAGIEKLKIALQGVAGPQADYRSAIAAAADVTARLNVPQEQSIAGITRLTAAVKGAGGPIADAETTFKNVTAAIKATGGSTEDVRGAITAMVQVFSKGKVSAEELSGQLGERLPGAVTMFAKANKMTLPELQKNLKAGTVGLNELMNFIVALGDKYNDTAETISRSNADAGARLTVVIDEMRADIGKALIPIGAEFQAAFADFIEKIAPTLTEVVPRVAKLFLELSKNIDVLVASITAIGLAIVAIKWSSIVKGIVAIKAVATGATFAAALLNPWVGLAAGIATAITLLSRYKREAATLSESVTRGEPGAREKAFAALNVTTSQISLIEKEIRDIKDKKQKGSNRDVIRLQRRLRELRTDRSDLKGVLKTTEPVAAVEQARFKYDPLTEDEDDPKADASQRLVDLTNSLARSEENVGKRVLITKRYMIDRQKVLESGLEGNKLEIALADQLGKFRQRIFSLNKQEAAEADRKAEKQKAEDERQAQAEAQKQDRIQQARVLAGEITQEEYDRNKTLREMGELLSDHPELYQKIKDKLTEIATPLGKFKAGLQDLIQESGNLADSLAVSSVNAISQLGDEFANFVVTGKANFKDLTASILRDMARIAARSALINAVSGIFNAISAGVSGSSGISGDIGGGLTKTQLPGSLYVTAANGMAFAQNKIVPYAMGGVVKKPTLFQFANGGSGRLGLMGEAGPEAILPLRRGSDGKLGVEAHSGGVGNIVVNVDAKGSQAEGDEPRANMLGKLLGAAVQSELIKQKRPGGLLAS